MVQVEIAGAVLLEIDERALLVAHDVESAADAGTLGTEGTSDCACATASESGATTALPSALFVLALVLVARRRR